MHSPISTMLFICPSSLLHHFTTPPLPSLQPVSAALLLKHVLCVLSPCLGALAQNPPFGPDVIIVALVMCTNDLSSFSFSGTASGKAT